MTSIVSLWIGERLGPVERACLQSMVRHSDRVSLYCYKKPQGLPEGVVVEDASCIIALDTLQARCGGRPDLYSDWFRYLLLRRGAGTWLDTDMYVVGEIDGERPYLFGEESPGCINNAVLRLPSDSALLAALLEPFRGQVIPRWLPWRSYVPLKVRQVVSGRVDLTLMPWGATSPLALTSLARQHGVDNLAEPAERFYPVGWRNADWIRNPDVGLEDVITPRTEAVHLWNECIKTYKNEPAPEGSFLSRLQHEGR